MQRKKRLLLFPVFFMTCSLLISCAKDDAQALKDNTEETPLNDDTQASDGGSSEALPLNDNIQTLPATGESCTLYTEDSSGSISLIVPEGFEISEFSEETRMRFEKKDDEYHVDALFVLWQNDVAEIESIMLKEANLTVVPDPSFSGNDNGNVHNIAIGDLSARGFLHSYTSSSNSSQEYRIWIPFKDGTSLVCIIECTKPGEAPPDYTEEMAAELIQTILGLQSE